MPEHFDPEALARQQHLLSMMEVAPINIDDTSPFSLRLLRDLVIQGLATESRVRLGLYCFTRRHLQ